MKKKKCLVSIDTSCPLPTFEDYHRFTMIDPQSKYKGHEGYVVRNWFPASTMNLVVDKLGQLEDIEDEIGISLILRHRIEMKVLKNYKSPLFCIGLDDKVREISFYKLVPDGIIVLYGEHENEMFELFYKDYKKTWALTKEELL